MLSGFHCLNQRITIHVVQSHLPRRKAAMPTPGVLPCAPEGTNDCEPTLDLATATEFLLRNAKKPQNFIYGELLTGGEVAFLVENLPKDGTGCPGWWLFDEMMGNFGTQVIAIQGNWTYGDNLSTVNQLTAGGGMALEEAAKCGPTGRYAAKWGFTTVEVLPQTSGIPGAYTRIYVFFKK
jgi:hypothetical protein